MLWSRWIYLPFKCFPLHCMRSKSAVQWNSALFCNCFNSTIYSYLDTSGGKSYNLYLNAFHFLTPVLIRHMRVLKTVVFLHWCLIRTVLFSYVVQYLPLSAILESSKMYNSRLWCSARISFDGCPSRRSIPARCPTWSRSSSTPSSRTSSRGASVIKPSSLIPEIYKLRSIVADRWQ